MAQHARPLSPHLQVYRPQLTSALSILHRMTGVFLALAAPLLCIWLQAIANGGETYDWFIGHASSLPGKLLLFAISFSLCYHLLNGIRHLGWDAGWGLDLRRTYLTGYLVVGLSLVTTAAVWAWALAAPGGTP